MEMVRVSIYFILLFYYVSSVEGDDICNKQEPITEQRTPDISMLMHSPPTVIRMSEKIGHM